MDTTPILTPEQKLAIRDKQVAFMDLASAAQSLNFQIREVEAKLKAAQDEFRQTVEASVADVDPKQFRLNLTTLEFVAAPAE